MALPRTSTSAVTTTSQVTTQEIESICRLRVSFDDFSVKTLTWVDFTSRLRSWSWEGGRGSELDEMDARTATFVLDNRDRALDPTNTSSVYYPDVVPMRRVWFTIETADESFDIFKGYVEGWGPSWPEGSEWSDAVASVRCTDGYKVLAMNTLPAASPDVIDYDEVVTSDEPIFYYRLGEPRGTKVVHHVKRKKVKVGGKWKKKKLKWKSHITRAEIEGVSGPAGTYKNTPWLGQAGAIAGDPDTAVKFRSSQSEYARVGPLDQSDYIDANRLTVECWVNLTNWSPAGTYQVLVSGPYSSPSSPSNPFGKDNHVFYLYQDGRGDQYYTFGVFLDGSGPNVEAFSTDPIEGGPGTWTHVVGTWDGSRARLYLNGEIADTTPVFGGQIAPPDDQEFIRFARDLKGSGHFLDGTLDEVAIYESVLSATRIRAHYQAGLLGFAAGQTSDRIESILDEIGEWPAWNIGTGARAMPKARYAGIEPSDLIAEAVDAEGLPSIFFFSKSGVPTFLGSGYRSGISETHAFADARGAALATGLLPSLVLLPSTSLLPNPPPSDRLLYEGIDIDDSDAFLYTEVRVTSSDDYTAVASDATAQGRFGTKVLDRQELDHASTADTDAYADSLLARFKDPMIRVREIRLNGSDDSVRAAMLSLELGDEVRVVRIPPGGGSQINQLSYVEFLSLEQAALGDPIIGRVGISPR